MVCLQLQPDSHFNHIRSNEEKLKMKKLLITTIILTLSGIFHSAIAQNGIQFGAHAGLNFATFTGGKDIEIDNDYDSRIGFKAGISVQIPMADLPFDVESGLFYSQKGAKGEYRRGLCCNAGNAGTSKLDYIDIPILSRFDFETSRSVTPHIVAGPYVAIKLNAKVNNAGAGSNIGDSIQGTGGQVGQISVNPPVGYTESIDEFVRTIDAGLYLGAGGSFIKGSLNLQFRASYSVGFIPVFTDEIDSGDKNRVFSLTAGVLF